MVVSLHGDVVAHDGDEAESTSLSSQGDVRNDLPVCPPLAAGRARARGSAPGQSLMLDSSMLMRRGAWPAGQHFTAKKRSTCKVASASAVPP